MDWVRVSPERKLSSKRKTPTTRIPILIFFLNVSGVWCGVWMGDGTGREMVWFGVCGVGE